MTWHGTNSPYSKPTNISKSQGYGPHHNDNNYKSKRYPQCIQLILFNELKSSKCFHDLAWNKQSLCIYSVRSLFPKLIQDITTSLQLGFPFQLMELKMLVVAIVQHLQPKTSLNSSQKPRHKVHTSWFETFSLNKVTSPSKYYRTIEEIKLFEKSK